MARRFKIFTRARRNNQLILWGRKSGFKVGPDKVKYSRKPQILEQLDIPKKWILAHFWTLCITVYRASKIHLKCPFWKFIKFREIIHNFCENFVIRLKKFRDFVIFPNNFTIWGENDYFCCHKRTMIIERLKSFQREKLR